MSARALSEEYNGKLAAYRATPLIYENRMRFEAMAEAIKEAEALHRGRIG